MIKRNRSQQYRIDCKQSKIEREENIYLGIEIQRNIWKWKKLKGKNKRVF